MDADMSDFRQGFRDNDREPEQIRVVILKRPDLANNRLALILVTWEGPVENARGLKTVGQIVTLLEYE